ncbi:chemotaxis response regulator protein-glutamate methylesterase [Planctomycetota bacterium]
MADKKIRVLVVDDTVIYRKIVSDILGTMPQVEVVGSANNGKIAMSLIEQKRPDLLILDVEMPEADGLEVLAFIQKKKLQVGAVMLSSFTQKGSQRTIKALELGAFDFIPKPESRSIEESKRAVQGDLNRVVEAFIRQAEIKHLLHQRGPSTGHRSATAPILATPVTTPRRAGQTTSNIVTIGISTGGPNALKEVLPKLPGNLGVPVLVVQHMPPVFTKSLADSLNRRCALDVMEATEGQIVTPNQVLIAPGGKQMKVVLAPDKAKRIIKLTDDPPENGCRPAVDYLFRSISQLYGGRVTAVVMTGMGCDGKLGMKLLKRQGALTIAQDESTCVVYGMPKEVIEAGLADVVAPLPSIADEICKTVKRNQAVMA